jgi:tetratricopeptide (TPR) repeat protein
LHEELGGASGLAFLDTSDIELGGQIPAALTEALLAARVIVVFADQTYFRSWYCLREFRIALSPFEALVRQPGTQEQLEASLAPIVVAIPVDGVLPADMDNLPPAIRSSNWPKANDVLALSSMVRSRLESSRSSIERISNETVSEAVRNTFKEQAALPSPGNLLNARMYPQQIMPSIQDRFVGRANDIWLIHFTLSTMRGDSDKNSPVIAALEGGAGFGKTRLALEYLHRFGPTHYPGGLFWVDATPNPQRIREQFHGILRTIEPQVPSFATFCQEGRDAQSELEHALHHLPADQPALFVVDNVPDNTAVASLKTWCPGIGKVSLLLTSRRRLSLAASEGVRPIPVNTLDAESAIAFLTHDLQSVDSREGWLSIAHWVGELPIALDVLNGALRAKALSYAHVLSKAKSVGPVLELGKAMDGLRKEVAPGALRGVSEALQLSYQSLSLEAQHSLRSLSLLSPTAIPWELAEKLTNRSTRAELTARSFILSASGDEVPVFGRVHRVVADFVRTQPPARANSMTLVGRLRAGVRRVLKAEKSESKSEFRAVFAALLTIVTEEACATPVRWPTLVACVPHMEWIYDGLFKMHPDMLADDSTCRVTAMRFGLLMTKMSGVSGLRLAKTAPLSQMSDLLEKLGPDHPDALTSMMKMAEVVTAAYDTPKAPPDMSFQVHLGKDFASSEYDSTFRHNIPRIREVIAVRKRILGAEHKDTMFSMSHLGASLFVIREFGGASETYRELLDSCLHVYGLRHSNTTIIAWNLAFSLMMDEQWDASDKIYDLNLGWLRNVNGQQLTPEQNWIRELVLAHDDPVKAAKTLQGRVQGTDDVSVVVAMGKMQLSLGDLEAAEANFTRALQLNPDDGESFVQRGETYRLMGRHEQALRDFDRAIALSRTEGAVLCGRGRVLSALNRYSEAIADFERALGLKPRDVEILSSLGVAYFNSGLSNDAMRNFDEVLAQDPEDKKTLLLRGIVHHDLKHYEKALIDFTQAAELDPRNTYASALRGEANFSLGRFEEALRDYDQALSGDPKQIWVYEGRGKAYCAMGRYSDALVDCNSAFEQKGGTSPLLALRGETYRLMERNEEALKDFSDLIAAEQDNAWALHKRGLLYLAMGRYGDAVGDLTGVLALNPAESIARVRRGEAYRRMGRYQEALKDFDEAMAADPSLSWASGNRGQAYFVLEKYPEAAADFSRVLEVDQGDNAARAYRGEAYRLMGRNQEALKDFDGAIAADPSLLWALQSRARVYAALERDSDAAADLTRVLESDPDDFTTHAQRGEIYFVMKRYTDALKDFDEAIAGAPSLSSAWAGRARVYLILERYPEAIANFTRFLESNPGDRIARLHRGESYRLMGQGEAALADFDQAIALEPSDSWALDSRARVYRSLKRYPEAIADFSKIVELDSKDYNARAARAETYRVMKRYEDALSDFDAVIPLLPQSSWAIESRARTYRALERHPEALNDFNRALELNPDDKSLLAGRGETYRLMKRYEAALADFDQAIALEPTDSWALDSRARVYRSLKRYPEAIADFSKIVELDSKDGFALAERGETFRLMKRYVEALADFDTAIARNYNRSWVFDSRARVYQSLERHAEAVHDFSSALELDHNDFSPMLGRAKAQMSLKNFSQALADFSQAIEQGAADDWYLYSRSLAHRFCQMPSAARQDLQNAIAKAKANHEKDPSNHRIAFNVALYSVALGEYDFAESLYETTARLAPAETLSSALIDLDGLLRDFPEHSPARRILNSLTGADQPALQPRAAS